MNDFFDDVNTPDDSVAPLTQLEIDWLTIASLRETRALVEGGHPPTYRDTLKFAAQVAPTLFDITTSPLVELSRSSPLELLLEGWREKAEADSRPLQDVIEEEILLAKKRIRKNELKGKSTEWLEYEKNALEKLLQQIASTVPISENQAIIRDALRRQLPPRLDGLITFQEDVDAAGNNYRQFLISNGQALRIRLAHPEKLETITGADIIYEQYAPNRRSVRVVALQYKLWSKDEGLYISPAQVERVNGQIGRLQKAFCRNRICQSSSDRGFRMPACSAYLRPTDKLQREKPRFATTGHHIPICQLEDLWESIPKKPKSDPNKPNGLKLLAPRIVGRAVSMETFQELFHTEMLGSEWIPTETLEEIYDGVQIAQYVTNPDNTAVFHVQKYDPLLGNIRQ